MKELKIEVILRGPAEVDSLNYLRQSTGLPNSVIVARALRLLASNIPTDKNAAYDYVKRLV